MASFLQLAINLLTSDTGSLTYQLVLAFSIAGAFQAALGLWPRLPGRRMATGLGMLLALRLALFIFSGLTWQGLADPTLLPPLDRAVTLLSLVLIIWLWLAPQASRAADGAMLLLGLLAAAMIVLGIVWWSGQSSSDPFNTTWAAWGAEIAALVLLALGGFVLLVSRPAGWGFGFSMLVLLAIGHLAQLLLPLQPGSYPGAVRLAQMAAYPLLLFLPQRIPASSHEIPTRPLASAATSRSFLDPPVLQSLQSLSFTGTQVENCRAITSILSHLMDADVCMLVEPAAEAKNLVIHCGYDRKRAAHIDGDTLGSLPLNTLASALKQGRPLRLSGGSTTSDLFALARALQLPQPGPMLSVPVALPESSLVLGVILLSPYSGKDWRPEDAMTVTSLAKPLAQFLQATRRFEKVTADRTAAQASLNEKELELAASRQERQKLLDQMAAMEQANGGSRAQAGSLAAVLAVQEEAQKTISELQAEVQRLKREAAAMVAEGQRQAAPHGQVEDGELRMALEEIALLRSALSEADKKIVALRAASGAGPVTPDQLMEASAMAHELRQPLSSIVGYTDFLLGESVGILGAMQRKFLDRVKVSTERMDRQVTELIAVLSQFSDHLKPDVQAVDLSAVIDRAIANTSQPIRRKNIILSVDLPERLPRLQSDRDALLKIFVLLLSNASEVTPDDGQVQLHVRYEPAENEREYVLIQVADGGPGIPPGDLPKVFNPRDAEEHSQIEGAGQENAAEFAVAKALVERLGGRIWVDSKPGSGAIFSVLLPVQPPLNAPRRNPNGREGRAA